MLEELRVSLFAQSLGTAAGVTSANQEALGIAKAPTVQRRLGLTQL